MQSALECAYFFRNKPALPVQCQDRFAGDILQFSKNKVFCQGNLQQGDLQLLTASGEPMVVAMGHRKIRHVMHVHLILPRQNTHSRNMLVRGTLENPVVSPPAIMQNARDIHQK